MLAELNMARRNPGTYAQLIASYPGITQQDRQETLQFMTQVIPCTTTLALDSGLTKVSADWVKTQGAIGDTGHGDFIQRFQRVGTYMGIAENLAYGNQTARDAVIQWIIDANIPTKGHRINIYNCSFDQLGVAKGPHNSIYRSMISVTFGKGFKAYTS